MRPETEIVCAALLQCHHVREQCPLVLRSGELGFPCVCRAAPLALALGFVVGEVKHLAQFESLTDPVRCAHCRAIAHGTYFETLLRTAFLVSFFCIWSLGRRVDVRYHALFFNKFTFGDEVRGRLG